MSIRIESQSVQSNHSRCPKNDIRAKAIRHGLSILSERHKTTLINAGVLTIDWDDYFDDLPVGLIQFYHEAVNRASQSSDYFEECIEYIFENMAHRLSMYVIQYGSYVVELIKQIVHDLYVDTDSVDVF